MSCWDAPPGSPFDQTSQSKMSETGSPITENLSRSEDKVPKAVPEVERPQTPTDKDINSAIANTKRSRSSKHGESGPVSAGTKRPRSSEDEDNKLISTSTKRSRPSEDEGTLAAPPESKRPRPSKNEGAQPRPRKRPGGASRIATADKEAVLHRQHQREEDARRAATTRGVQDVVRQHYNAVPQRGRDWRKTDSRIKGLRSFNNWVKSTIIHKFSPSEGGDGAPLRILDIGCGKGGDLGKWQQAPQTVELYVGIDPAEVSIDQARDRYSEMRSRGGGRGGRGGYRGARPQRTFDAEFVAQDAFGQSIGRIPIVRDVGFDPAGGSRWGGGGFDVVSMMFCMHYAFESEAKTRGMLQNVAGSLKKGGRFLGTIPNSDMIRSRVEAFHKRQEAKSKALENGDTTHESEAPNGECEGSKHGTETKTEENGGPTPSPQKKAAEDAEEGLNVASWGNSIYRVRFPGQTPKDGVFRPPFGWKYNYFMEEAVEVPEYVVPWEAFRAYVLSLPTLYTIPSPSIPQCLQTDQIDTYRLAEDYNLEQQYRKPFLDVWKEEKDSPVFGPLSERMGVRDRGGTGGLMVSDEEMEACAFYHAFCFYKV